MTDTPAIGAPPRIRILIADDHVTVREGLAAIIGRQADMVVVAEAATGNDAIELWRDHRPDVTLMDLRMPGLDGVGAMLGICAIDASARVVVLTTFDSDHDISRAIRAGAKAYLLKDSGREDVLECIRSVHAGETRLPPARSATPAT
jgi:DNA-binding NarL/FixJ family response regulator